MRSIKSSVSSMSEQNLKVNRFADTVLVLNLDAITFDSTEQFINR